MSESEQKCACHDTIKKHFCLVCKEYGHHESVCLKRCTVTSVAGVRCGYYHDTEHHYCSICNSHVEHHVDDCPMGRTVTSKKTPADRRSAFWVVVA